MIGTSGVCKLHDLVAPSTTGVEGSLPRFSALQGRSYLSDTACSKLTIHQTIVQPGALYVGVGIIGGQSLAPL
jgi:hypothetical protein